MTAATSDFRRATNGDGQFDYQPAIAFWTFNGLLWATYAIVLMLPWLDRYTISQMLPNKVLIAGTGIAVTGALRTLYARFNVKRMPAGRLLATMLTTSIVGALLFDATVLTLTQGPSAVAIRWQGLWGGMNGGVPVMGRAGQYALLLFAWSLALHLWEQRTRLNGARLELPQSNGDRPLSVIGSTVHARDGSRHVLIDRDDIQWIAADGDYVRLHMNGRNLLIRATMKHASTLLAPLGFIRVHRSAIINPRYAREVARDTGGPFVLLRSGVRVRIGRQYAGQLTGLFNDAAHSSDANGA